MDTNKLCVCGNKLLFLEKDCTFFCDICDTDEDYFFDNNNDDIDICSKCFIKDAQYIIINKINTVICEQCLTDHICNSCKFIHDVPFIYIDNGIKYKKKCNNPCN